MLSLNNSNSTSKYSSFFSSDSNELDRNSIIECWDSIKHKSFFSFLINVSFLFFFSSSSSSSLNRFCSSSICSSMDLPCSSKACFLHCCSSLIFSSSCFWSSSICSSINLPCTSIFFFCSHIFLQNI